MLRPPARPIPCNNIALAANTQPCSSKTCLIFIQTSNCESHPINCFFKQKKHCRLYLFWPCMDVRRREVQSFYWNVQHFEFSCLEQSVFSFKETFMWASSSSSSESVCESVMQEGVRHWDNLDHCLQLQGFLGRPIAISRIQLPFLESDWHF